MLKQQQQLKKVDGYGQCLVCPDQVGKPYGNVAGQSDHELHYLCCRICSFFWDALGFIKQREWFKLSREERTKRFNESKDLYARGNKNSCAAKQARNEAVQSASTSVAG